MADNEELSENQDIKQKKHRIKTISNQGDFKI